MKSRFNVIDLDQPHIDIERGAERFQAIRWLDYCRSTSIDGDMLRPLHRSPLESKHLRAKPRAKDGYFHLHLAEGNVSFEPDLYLKIVSIFIRSFILSFFLSFFLMFG